MVDKKAIRAQVRQAFSCRTAEELSAESSRICASLGERIPDKGIILLYSSLPDEVCLNGLAACLRASGHTVLLPVVVGEEMILRAYEGAESMRQGAFGILEPQGTEFTDYAAIDLAVVPGRAFTPAGARLGRGRGYYDKFLPLLHCPLIGVCYPWQVVPSIPMDEHDIYMNEVVF